MFRIVETGEVYQVDDYGWALAGTNTIDLYKPSRAEMNTWGVRRVTIENLQWGDPAHSLSVLRPRARYRHIERMVRELHERYAELSRPVPVSSTPVLPAQTQTQLQSPAQPQPASAPLSAFQPVAGQAPPVAQAVTPPVSSQRPAIGAARDPFFANTSR